MRKRLRRNSGAYAFLIMFTIFAAAIAVTIPLCIHQFHKEVLNARTPGALAKQHWYIKEAQVQSTTTPILTASESFKPAVIRFQDIFGQHFQQTAELPLRFNTGDNVKFYINEQDHIYIPSAVNNNGDNDPTHVYANNSWWGSMMYVIVGFGGGVVLLLFGTVMLDSVFKNLDPNPKRRLRGRLGTVR